MGYILEPDGVDFTVVNKEYTPEDEKVFRSFFEKRRKQRAKCTPDTLNGVKKIKKSLRSRSQKS
jgi:hypothetical protein